MEKELNIIDFDYKNANKTSFLTKFTAIFLMFYFTFTPLYEFVDVFRKEFYSGMCCILPCPDIFSGYFFI